MFKKAICLILVIICLLPTIALAEKSYNSAKIYSGEISVNDTVFKAGDKITGGSRISVELEYVDAAGKKVAGGKGTVKSVTIDGEKVTEWKMTGSYGSEIIINNRIYQAAYGFTMTPAYAAADSEGYYNISEKTYSVYAQNAKNKKVKFTGSIVDTTSDFSCVSIAENMLVAIKTDSVFELDDRVQCKGTITDYANYKEVTIPVVTCEEAKIQQYDPLKKGDKGAEVLQMKERLQALGYFRASAELSDAYNDTCAERVQMFQKNNGLPATGNADAETLSLLYSDAAKSNQ